MLKKIEMLTLLVLSNAFAAQAAMIEKDAGGRYGFWHASGSSFKRHCFSKC